MSAVTHLANVTLSSLYFDITKDALYANAADDLERRTIVTVLHQVPKTIIRIYF
jgi:isoleucyl-tRNA synthetase